MPRRVATALSVLVLSFAPAHAHAQNRIDTQRPDAPELAAYGEYPVGVRTVRYTHVDRVDVAAIEANASEGAQRPDPLPTTDRELVVEMFYPAAESATGATTHETVMRDGTPIALTGRSMRDAEARTEEAFPLVLVSHGYPGNRFLMSHLAENIASKGYVVASIDHPASTYADLGAFADTLRHRPRDQLFVLGAIEADAEGDTFLSGLVDTSRTGLIGYSMGGYDALTATGAGITEDGAAFPFGNTLALPDVNVEGASTEVEPDERIRTVVALGPWGRNRDMWNADALADVSVPTLLIVGSQDDVSGYETGVARIFEELTGTDRALLTFVGANHNAGAPMPPPAEAVAAAKGSDGLSPWDHYGDAVWDNVRMNNITQHFTTAWLDRHLKGNEEMDAYLDLVPNAEDGVYAVEDGAEGPSTPTGRAFPTAQPRACVSRPGRRASRKLIDQGPPSRYRGVHGLLRSRTRQGGTPNRGLPPRTTARQAGAGRSRRPRLRGASGPARGCPPRRRRST